MVLMPFARFLNQLNQLFHSSSPTLNRYEYSLASFLTVFNLTLNTSKKDSMLEGRLRNVTEALTFDVYR